MKLLYVYVEHQRALYGASMNFDSEERFELKNVPGRVGELEFLYKKQISLGPSFFNIYDKTESGGIVESVSGIIGKNGSGKTSVASSVYNLGVDREDGYRKTYAVIVYKSGKRYKCVHNHHWRISKAKLPEYVSKNWDEVVIENLNDLPFHFVYYSPFTTTENVMKSWGEKFTDISTGNLLRDAESDDDRNGTPIFEYHGYREYVRILRFLSACENVEIPEEIEFRLPVGVNLIVDIEHMERYPGNLGRRGNADFIHNKGSLVSLDDAFALANSQYLPFQAFGFWAYTLIDSMASFDVGREHSVVKLCIACKKIYQLFVNGVLNDEDCEKGMEIALSTIKSMSFDNWTRQNKGSLLKFFQLLYGYYMEGSRSRRQRISSLAFQSCLTLSPYKVNEKVLLERLACEHAKIGVKYGILKFQFEKMSSGEMAFLSMFGRLYDVFHPLHDEDGGASCEDVLVYLDEAETTMHPELQRVLVLAMLWFVSNFAKDRKVHLLFASHSPLLLSDIPSGNCIYLHRSNQDDCRICTEFPDDINTFGANIFDLYAKKFNLSNGAVGAFATKKINSVLGKLAAHITARQRNASPFRLEVQDKCILDAIGDPIVRKYIDSLKASGLVCEE